MLAMCEESVRAQTLSCQHVVVHDEVGVGIAGMYAAIKDHAQLVTGRYVMVLSDDNVLVEPGFADALQIRCRANGYPDVVVFQGQTGGTLQPASWGGEPVETMIDLSCFAVQREIWQKHADCWGERYEGDFDFIHHLWAEGYRFDWWMKLAFRALQISRGAPEAVA